MAARINTSGLKYASKDDGMRTYLHIRKGSYERGDKRSYGSLNSDIAKVYQQKAVQMENPDFIMLGATKLVDPTDKDNYPGGRRKVSFAEREDFNRAAVSMPHLSGWTSSGAPGLMRSRVDIPEVDPQGLLKTADTIEWNPMTNSYEKRNIITTMKNAYDPLTDRWEKRAMERLSYSAVSDLLEGRDKKSTLFERLALGGPKTPSVSLDYLNLCSSESSGTAALLAPPEKPERRIDAVLGLMAPPRLALKGPECAVKPLPPCKRSAPMVGVTRVQAPLFVR